MLYSIILLAAAAAASPVNHASVSEAPLISSIHAETIPNQV